MADSLETILACDRHLSWGMKLQQRVGGNPINWPDKKRPKKFHHLRGGTLKPKHEISNTKI